MNHIDSLPHINFGVRKEANIQKTMKKTGWKKMAMNERWKRDSNSAHM